MLACRLDGAGAFYAFFCRAIVNYSSGKEAASSVSVSSVSFGCIWSFEKCLDRWFPPRSEQFGRQVHYVVGICRRDFRLGEEASGSTVARVIVMGTAASEGWLEALLS